MHMQHLDVLQLAYSQPPVRQEAKLFLTSGQLGAKRPCESCIMVH